MEFVNGKSVAIQAIDTLRSDVEDVMTSLNCDEWSVSREVTDRAAGCLLKALDDLGVALHVLYNAEETAVEPTITPEDV